MKKRPIRAKVIGLLAQLQDAHQREMRLMELLAERDAQLRMVLEERFYKPIQPAPNRLIQSTVVSRPEEMTDTVQFDPKADRAQIDREAKNAEAADASLAQLLDEEADKIAREHEAAQAGETLATEEPVEMLERMEAKIEPPKTRAQRSKEAARQIAGGQE